MTERDTGDHTTEDAGAVAEALVHSVRLLVRRLRTTPADGGLTQPETTALSRLDRDGPTTSSALAKAEQIRPQSMGATLSGLETRGLIQRQPDPDDGRRIVLSLTDTGRQVLSTRRDAKAERVTHTLTSTFTPTELDQLRTATTLIERLAHDL